MDCQIRQTGHIAELVLEGNLDSSWSSYFSDRMDEVVRAGALEVLLDMARITYLSSNGIGLLVRYHRQLTKIGGRFRIVADSEAVSHVLRLTGVWKLLHDDAPSPEMNQVPARTRVAIDRERMALQVFASANGGGAARLELMGDPTRLCGGFSAEDERTWRAAPDSVALGLGALGPSFHECRGRYGEFLAVSGVAAYRPTAGPGRPDFEQTAGTFVPKIHVLYGLAFPMQEQTIVRFEAHGGSGSSAVSLSEIAQECLEQTDGGLVGLALAGETEGLVGAALLRSPANVSSAVDLFAQPGVRDWLSLTPEPEHSRSTALVVGVATRNTSPSLAPFVRPLSGSRRSKLQGHFHAAIVPYSPLAGGAIDLDATVAHLIEPGRIDSILHLLGDPRPIVGAGESKFTRGVIWFVPLNVDRETD